MSPEQNFGGKDPQLPSENRQDNAVPETSTDEEAKAYYERFLRKEHPEYDDATVAQKVDQAIGDEMFKHIIKLRMQFDKEVKDRHPDWDAG